MEWLGPYADLSERAVGIVIDCYLALHSLVAIRVREDMRFASFMIALKGGWQYTVVRSLLHTKEFAKAYGGD